MIRPTNTKAGQIGRLVDLLVTLCFWLACLALVIIVCVTLYEITMRYFFNAPTRWVSDSVRYLLAAVIMLGLPEMTRDGGHVAITLFLDYVPRDHVYRRLLGIISAGACFFVTYLASDVALQQFERWNYTQGMWRIPRFWISGSITIGFCLAGLMFLMIALRPRQED